MSSKLQFAGVLDKLKFVGHPVCCVMRQTEVCRTIRTKEKGREKPMPTNGPEGYGVGAAAVTSLSTFAGLVLCLVKERREPRKSDIEARRMELELERAALEIATLRKRAAADDPDQSQNPGQ